MHLLSLRPGTAFRCTACYDPPLAPVQSRDDNATNGGKFESGCAGPYQGRPLFKILFTNPRLSTADAPGSFIDLHLQSSWTLATSAASRKAEAVLTPLDLQFQLDQSMRIHSDAETPLHRDEPGRPKLPGHTKEQMGNGEGERVLLCTDKKGPRRRAESGRVNSTGPTIKVNQPLPASRGSATAATFDLLKFPTSPT